MEKRNDVSDQVSVRTRSSAKRKAAESPEGARSEAKRRHGTPCSIVEIPTEMLFKIFEQLEPLDLLHLARTSKGLRELLMTRSSIFLWKAARSNIPGPGPDLDGPCMPDCPEDLSEPQYADLLFGADCFFCGTELDGSGKYFWGLRLRTCWECLQDDNCFVDRPENSRNKLLPCIPTVSAWRYQGPLTIGGRKTRPMAFKSSPPKTQIIPLHIKVAWEDEYKRAKKKTEWLSQKVSRQKVIEKHADACLTWYQKLPQYREKEKSVLIEQRRHTIVKYIQSLGWSDELAQALGSVKKPQDDPIVTAACQQPLNANVLSGLELFINEFMEDTKAKRLMQERDAFLVTTFSELNQVYNTFISTLPVNALYPTISDVLQDAAVRRIIDTTPLSPDRRTNRFGFVVSLFPAVIRRWQKSIEVKLSALIARACNVEQATNPKTVLDLATTWFTCSRCKASLCHPRVLVHKCVARAEVNWVDTNLDTYRAIVKRLFQQVPWNDRQFISFESKNLTCMSIVVKLCGLDPEITTRQEMDVADHIIECVTCNNPRKGRLTMTWSGVLDHLNTQHSRTGMKIELLRDEEKRNVRARMNEEQARHLAKEDCKSLICTHCKLQGNMVDLAEHVVSCHGWAEPADGDIVPVLDDHVPCLYWLWPPRKPIPQAV